MVLIANMHTERRKVGDYYHNHQLEQGLLMEPTPSSKCYSNNSSPLVLHPYSFSSGDGKSTVGGCGSGGGGGLGYIEHTVSKFDTLVGVAVKYGVEVADIKRMNGLTTDLQMFALKSLQIPLPGRHPPSPIMSNRPTSSEVTLVNDRHSDLFNSIKSLKLSSSSQRNVSPSMNTLGYYGLKPDQNGIGESFEMAVYCKGSACYSKDGAEPSQTSDQSVGVHRKPKSLVNGFSEKGEGSVANDKEAGSDKCLEKLVRRRKSEVDLENDSPEMLVKQENSSNNGAANKGMALRQKAGSRTSNDAEAGLQNLFPLGLKDALMAETLSGVRKSSSTPSFQDAGNNNNGTSSSIWPTAMLSLTADLQALSTAAITISIFDGLPNPISGRKNKAALD